MSRHNLVSVQNHAEDMVAVSLLAANICINCHEIFSLKCCSVIHTLLKMGCCFTGLNRTHWGFAVVSMVTSV